MGLTGGQGQRGGGIWDINVQYMCMGTWAVRRMDREEHGIVMKEHRGTKEVK
jgi:hypothetical protein